MAERPDMLYGNGIASHYQGQQLKLAKQFRPLGVACKG
jgi:dCTP deaminase